MEHSGQTLSQPPRRSPHSPSTNNNTGSNRKDSPRSGSVGVGEDELELPWTLTRSPKHKKPRLDDPPRPELENGKNNHSQARGTPSPLLHLPGPAAAAAAKDSPTYLKLSDEREFETELSSPTPPQSSSDVDQTPKSSNDGDGGDKTESESSKSVCTIINNTASTSSNGPLPGFVPPSITKRSVTLQMLLGAGILKTGEGTMSLEYHGQKFMGDLLENGHIRSQETSQIFSSPSAWAIACKQIINPEKILRKSGCGWASIKYKGLKLDYYKAVWFKRLREGSIDIRNISNGASSSSSDTEDEEPHCILKFGEHFESSPRHQTAQQVGAKVLISCTEFKEMERIQPFHVKVSLEALALADFHSNITTTETVGYLSGQWNGDHNCLKLEVAHPCRVLMPHSSSVECDTERNRIALEIQRLGHEVVGWYHSHPKAPPIPSKDDIARQLDYQIMMKGATESSYIPCVGLIISPLCYSDQEDLNKSKIQFFWVMPPPENRPLEMGRPMHLDHETVTPTNFDPQKLLLNMAIVADFYRENKELIDLNSAGIGKFSKIKDALSVWLTDLKVTEEFWEDLNKLIISKTPVAPKPPPIDVTPIPTPQLVPETSSSTPPASSSDPTTTVTSPTSTADPPTKAMLPEVEDPPGPAPPQTALPDPTTPMELG